MVNQFDVLIVDPDPESRMRLRQATSVCTEFGSVMMESSLTTALNKMKERMNCNVVFISQTFESGESTAFVQAARETPYGQYAAYIMVLKSARQNRTGVAQNMSLGVDGFLFQPYSVDALRETTSIAAEVRDKAREARKAASRKLLATAIVPQIERIYEQHLLGKPIPQQKLELKQVVRSLYEMFPDESQRFFELLVDEFERVPPPPPPALDDLSPIARRRRMREEERRRREEEAAAQATQDPNAPQETKKGGYFIRRK